MFSSKNLLDFRRTRSLTLPRFPRAGKLDPVFRVFVSDYFSILSACIIDDRQPNQPLRPRPWQRQVWRQKKGKASDRDQNRQHDESDRLSPQKWAVRLCAVGEPGAAKPVTQPEQCGETEVEQIKRTRRPEKETGCAGEERAWRLNKIRPAQRSLRGRRAKRCEQRYQVRFALAHIIL
jgi:hypothetical protein